MANVKDYYETLGLSKGAGAAEIKKAYRRLARKHHPDLNPGDKGAEEKFKVINDAYGVLSDPKKREQYDQFGHAAFEPGGAGAGGAGGAGAGGFDFGDLFGKRAGGAGAGGFDFGDIFGQRAGGPGGTGAGGFIRGRGADLVTEMSVTLDEAFTGATKKMSIRRDAPCKPCRGTGAESTGTCPACGGRGGTETSRGFFRMTQTCPACGGTGTAVTKICPACGGAGSTPKTETLNVKIPPGVDGGTVLRLRGMGGAGEGGGPPGDLQLRVKVNKHPLFERKGSNLYMDLPVTFGEAALGAKVEVPTIDGTARMTIPPGTQSAQRFKLRGKGMPRPNSRSRGDMYVSVHVAVPKKLDEKQRAALDVLDAAYAGDPREGLKR